MTLEASVFLWPLQAFYMVPEGASC